MTDPSAETPKPKSDLKVRVLSAIVMVAVTAAVFWIGGLAFKVFVWAIALGLFWEWWRLVSKITPETRSRAAWMVGGLVYIAWPCSLLVWAWTRHFPNNTVPVITGFALLLVIFVDVGAYAAGRTFGGKKIAPSISPSKTWAGLYGGMAAAVVFAIVYFFAEAGWKFHPGQAKFQLIIMFAAAICAPIMACIAQAGDFFESWMKRRAGVKDSGTLIPGHGGLLDRLDGHLAVLSTLPLVFMLAVGILTLFEG